MPVAEGEVGELIIGGVGLARYLDPAKDAEKYAPMPSLGWERAYRSGDLVRYEPEGLIFQGRADEQVKLGGRRIELGEIDAALQSLPDVAGAAAAVQTTAAGNQILVGYLAAVSGRGHRPCGRPRTAGREPAGPPHPAADARRVAADQDQRQSGPPRPAVAAQPEPGRPRPRAPR